MIIRSLCDKYNLAQVKCIFNKQIRAELIEKEVETIITQIVSNSTFAKKMNKKSIFK